MYKTGGLEVDASQPAEILTADNVDYVVSDRFKMMLRDNLIDWGTFLETYGNNFTEAAMFEQVIKLLNIKDNQNIRDVMLPLVQKIYALPAESHVVCMLKQFLVYQPMSIAAYTLFTTICKHYEAILQKFITARNKYIADNKTGDKPNNWDTLLKYWTEVNNERDLQSSSLPLLFLNPTGVKSKIHISIKGVDLESLKKAIKSFHYQGYCAKVPYERLEKLLEFPINEFVAAIKKIDPNAKFPDYPKLEKKMAEMLASAPAKPVVSDTYKRLTPPEATTDKIELVKWYVDEILNLRKTLLPFGKAYETYYTEHAKLLLGINDFIKEEFEKLE